MSQPISRLNDDYAPHPGWSPLSVATKSDDVIAGGLGVCRESDVTTLHIEYLTGRIEIDTQESGSETVLTNGKKTARREDTTAEGSTLIAGENTVIVGG